MKIGETVPVTIGGHVVAQAQIKELSDGTATLIVPATRVVMGVTTTLGDLPNDNTGTEVIIDGVDNTDTETSEVVESQNQVEQSNTQSNDSSNDSINTQDVVQNTNESVESAVESVVESAAPVQSQNQAVEGND